MGDRKGLPFRRFITGEILSRTLDMAITVVNFSLGSVNQKL
jgi:hypothetical protein